MEEDEEVLDQMGLFEVPADFAPPKPPTLQKHILQSGETVNIHLVGFNLLEGHYLWNGARYISQYFEEHLAEVKDRTVFELGAGGGLPSIVSAILGARKVVVTDYPDTDLQDMINKNMGESRHLIPAPADRIVCEGYAWGSDPSHLLAHLGTAGEKFDVLILADLLFKHPQHGNMLKTVELTLSRKEDSAAFVFFTSYRPWLQQADLAFFDLARERGFLVERVFEKRLEKPMFENDPGDVEIQKLCTGWTIRWPEAKWSS